MATTRTKKQTAPYGAEIMTDLFYAGLGAAAFAKDETETLFEGVGKKSTQISRTVTRRLGEFTEELGETLEETVPEVVAKPLGRIRDQIGETYESSRKQTRRALKDTKRTLKRRGKTSWKSAVKRASSMARMIEVGLQPLLVGIGLVTRQDLARIDARLDKLSRQLRQLEKRA